MDRISELMGDGASMAAFRFAAFEEGRRIGSGYRPNETRRMLDRLDAVLGHRSEILDEGTPLKLQVQESSMLESDREIVQGIALGVLEGALLASRGRRHAGTVVGPHADGGVEVALEAKE